MATYYQPTTTIINLATELGKLLGRIEANNKRKPTPRLRKYNQIRTYKLR